MTSPRYAKLMHRTTYAYTYTPYTCHVHAMYQYTAVYMVVRIQNTMYTPSTHHLQPCTTMYTPMYYHVHTTYYHVYATIMTSACTCYAPCTFAAAFVLANTSTKETERHICSCIL